MGDLPSLIEGTLEGAQRTADIVHGLKRFSAMDSEERVPVNLDAVIERAIHWVQKGRPTPVDVHWQAGAPCTVMGSAGQLQQVMMNLLQNAFDAVGGPGAAAPCVWVAMACEGAQVHVTVPTTGRASRPSTCCASSTPSSPPSRWARARAWACRSATASSSSTAGA